MHPELERILAEDEIARAATAAASANALARVEATRAELARARADQLRRFDAEVAAAVASIEAEADRDIAARRARREAFERDRAEAAAAAMDAAVDLFVRIVRADSRERGAG